MSQEEFQTLVLKELKELKTGQEEIKKRLDNIEAKQNENLDMLRNLEAKNADRHREISNDIEELKQDFNTIEKVTAKNWKDIADIKDLKKAK